MLHARYNENGSKILCEQANIFEIEKSGYSYKDNPKINVKTTEVVEDYEEEIEKTPVKKTRRTPRKTPVKKDTKGVVL